MTQHFLLMMVAPPLILLGQPVLPVLRGLPRAALKEGLSPFLTWRPLRRLGHAITDPLVCWLLFVAALVFWHLPRPYELGLHSKGWHEVQHACFFFTSMLFWWPVIQVWPSHPRWPRWTIIPYLVLADLVNTILSAAFTFSSVVLYPTYAAAPRLWGISALDDQAVAGAIMWVPGSVAFLVPAVILVMQALNPRVSKPRHIRFLRRPVPPRRFDLLRAPVLGPLLRYRHFRRFLQTAMLLLAAAVVIDGLLGPQVSPLNLAGVLPWTYWRGLAVIALMAAGNLFCMACPFTLPRDLGRRLLPARYQWPKKLRSKWIAIGLLILFLWAYEAFSLWDSPWWTAWVIAAYFGTASVIDGLFRGASFCKYVCPIGQFHFLQSLVSPFEVRVRQPEVCGSCTSHSCLHGIQGQRGCEMNLFQPTKASNFDCTFCLDCVHSCAYENVGLIAVAPARSIVKDRRLSQRRDIAVVAAILVFGAFVNAAFMTEPVMTWIHECHARLRLTSLLPITTAFFLAGMLLIPAVLVFLCGRIQPHLTGRFILALAPLGFSMWLAHFSWHLVVGWHTAIPAFERIHSTLLSGVSPSAILPPWLPPFQILALGFGLLLTLYLTWRIGCSHSPRARSALAVMAPWSALSIALYSLGLWILDQPMQMRGMVMR